MTHYMNLWDDSFQAIKSVRSATLYGPMKSQRKTVADLGNIWRSMGKRIAGMNLKSSTRIDRNKKALVVN